MAPSTSVLSFTPAPEVSGFLGVQPLEMTPVAFEGHFGALHQPAPGRARGVTVVLCPPVGRDARCAYRPLLALSEDLARRGFCVLRYDHLGAGDSMSVEPEADQWTLWLAGLEQAAAFARACGGGSRLVLAGLRIGASLAALAARDVRPDALMLLAPIASGRAWTRELQMAAAMVGLAPEPGGAIEIDGLRLSGATVATLQGFDIKKLPAPDAPVFLATPAPEPRLAARLGDAVTPAAFDGYAELFKEAHLNAPPVGLFAEAAAWLEALGPAPLRDLAALPPARLSTADWTEEAVVFGPGLRGVLTLPAQRRGRQGVIFGNTGGDPRSGIGAFASKAARALAADGVAALRFDFAGLGESDSPDPGLWRPHVYETPRVDDFRAAARELEALGYDELTLAGVCAGGYQALKGAIAEPRFRRVVAINAWLVWRPDDSLELRRANVGKRRRVNVLALLKPSGWRRLLRHEIQIRAAIGLLLAALGRRFNFRPPDAACREMREGVERIARDGAQVRIVVGRDDESLEGLEGDFGPRGRWLARLRGVEVRMIPYLDHGLFSCESQAMAHEELKRSLRPPTDPGAGRPRRCTRRRGRTPRYLRRASLAPG